MRVESGPSSSGICRPMAFMREHLVLWEGRRSQNRQSGGAVGFFGTVICGISCDSIVIWLPSLFNSPPSYLVWVMVLERLWLHTHTQQGDIAKKLLRCSLNSSSMAPSSVDLTLLIVIYRWKWRAFIHLILSWYSAKCKVWKSDHEPFCD